MFNQKNLDSRKLVDATVDLIIQEDLSDLNLCESSAKPYYFWGKLTEVLIGNFEKTISLQIWKNWKYNIKQYRDRVIDGLNERDYKKFNYNKYKRYPLTSKLEGLNLFLYLFFSINILEIFDT